AEKEEQLVAAAGLADRTADRVPPILLFRDRLGIPVALVRPAVAVPIGVALDVVHGAPELVRAALGDRGYLDAARPAVFGLVVRDEHLDFPDRLHVHRELNRVAAGIDDSDAVEQRVVRAAAAQPRRVGAAAVAHAGRQ